MRGQSRLKQIFSFMADAIPLRSLTYSRIAIDDEESKAFSSSSDSIRSLHQPRPERRRPWLHPAAVALVAFGLGFLFHLSLESSLLASLSPSDLEPLPSLKLPPSFTMQRPPNSFDRAADVETAQSEAFAMHGEPRASCSGLSTWHSTRYASLREANETIYLAMNIKDVAGNGMLTTFIQEMPMVLRFLGPRNVHIAIDESGSGDDTPKLLVLIAQMLEALGTPFTITSRGKTEQLDMGFDHRIQSLSRLRNRVLAPLLEGKVAKQMPNGKFDEVLYINDVVFCAADLLEVLYQKRVTGAHQACSVDWDWNMRVVYDRWVLRPLSGNTVYNRTDLNEYLNEDKPLDEKVAPPIFPLDAPDRERFESLKPLQVFSCWNGMSVFSASAFVQHGIRFRMAQSDTDNGHPKSPTDLVSECYLTSVDLWKKGMGKIVLATRARVAYGVSDYEIYRKDKAHGEVEELPTLKQEDHFEWVTTPPAKVAMQDVGYWWNEDRWAPWDEP